MREELHGELVEKHAQEWRPQRYGWTNPANSPASRAAHDKAITICVTRGRSARTTHRLTKPRASIGKMGGGADMQIDDPEVCPLHCAVAMTENGERKRNGIDGAREVFECQTHSSAGTGAVRPFRSIF